MSRVTIPASSTVTLHGAHTMAAEASPGNAGAIGITAYNNDGTEVFDLTIFTDNGIMATELAIAINGVLLKHDRCNSEHLRAAA